MSISMCDKLHAIVNQRQIKRFDYRNVDEIPRTSGIYIFFEKGRKYKQWDQIVRVGKATNKDNLYRRIKNHFFGHCRQSIFRCYIARELFLKYKNNLTKKWQKKQVLSIEEDKITKRMRDFQCCVVLIDAQNNKKFEESIISTLKQDNKFANCKMYLKQGANGKALNNEQLEYIKERIV